MQHILVIVAVILLDDAVKKQLHLFEGRGFGTVMYAFKKVPDSTAVASFHNGVDYLVLALEVVIDAALAYARFLCNGIDGYIVISSFGDKLLGGFKNKFFLVGFHSFLTLPLDIFTVNGCMFSFTMLL